MAGRAALLAVWAVMYEGSPLKAQRGILCRVFLLCSGQQQQQQTTRVERTITGWALVKTKPIWDLVSILPFKKDCCGCVRESREGEGERDREEAAEAAAAVVTNNKP